MKSVRRAEKSERGRKKIEIERGRKKMCREGKKIFSNVLKKMKRERGRKKGEMLRKTFFKCAGEDFL